MLAGGLLVGGLLAGELLADGLLVGCHWLLLFVVFSFNKNVIIYYLSIYLSIYLSKVYEYSLVYVPHVCLVPMEVRRRHQIPWNWSFRWL